LIHCIHDTGKYNFVIKTSVILSVLIKTACRRISLQELIGYFIDTRGALSRNYRRKSVK